MSKFYTSVERFGNNILWRGYEDGKRFSYKVPFKPTLYLQTKNNQDAEFEFRANRMASIFALQMQLQHHRYLASKILILVCWQERRFSMGAGARTKHSFDKS